MEWIEPKEYYKNLPRKRVAAEAIFFDSKENILIIKPSYREYWDIPGGIVEAGETPDQAVVREVKEEIGLELSFPKLLVVEYRLVDEPKGDAIMFTFDGGIIKDSKALTIPVDEISEFRFVPVSEALLLLGKNQQRRVKSAIQAQKEGKTIYDNGN